ncbi:MAG: electron transport complex subunit E [Gammaproteobacteria bacterium]|nr:electron transport complex subunit E [Gammaproteobacteria bacterium]MDH3560234.1 electron transport complex subunit E [Gammaproteobacteria bacterium]
MTEPAYTHIIREGLWNNNPGLVQLLGLCPLLAITNSLVNGLGLGLATTLTLVTTNVIVSGIRHLVRPEVRIPVYVLVIASVVTVIELAMNAWFHDLYMILGIFIPLIVTNCAIIGRAESFASKQTVDRAFIDGLAMGVGFTLVLVTLGGLRELVGQGTLFAQAHLMFGEAGRALALTLIDDYRGFLLAILPPGAFIGLGLLIALTNVINARREERALARDLDVARASQA